VTGDLIGTLRVDGPHRAVKLTRSFNVGHMALWDAISTPEHLAHWFATVTGTFTEGGAVDIIFDPDDPTQTTTGTILECRPPHRLVVVWTFPGETESYVYVELLDQDESTQLSLDHRQLPLDATAGYGAGWQTYFEQLTAHLASDATSGPRWDDRFKELRPAYQEELDRLG
jgi:uncharacterized protein YndB with AHSA1/START domain